MKHAIAETGGREVFFAGTLGPDGCVHEVRVCARGHDTAVPAIIRSVKKGEVVIHNHPSGSLEPSEADLHLSIVFGHQGNGMYIVDNGVTRTYVVVEPFQDKQAQALDAAALEQALAPGSRLAKAIPHFESRPQQLAMIDAVTKGFNEEALMVIEAPTGVGKTMAYLIPAVQWALVNHERVVISTKTINLQEQLIRKDIPVVAKCCRKPFTAVLVKGRHNYLCQRKLQRALSDASLFEDEGERKQLEAIAAWAEKTQDGSLSDLPFVPMRELWERICSEADTCSYSHCPSPSKCFIGRARREIAKADIIIANHHIVFSDLAVKKDSGDFTSLGVLPAYQRVIFDEAHTIEDSATELFGVEASRVGALALISRFVRLERNQERGLLPGLKLRLISGATQVPRQELEALLDVIDHDLLPALTVCREGLNEAFDVLRHFAAERCGQIGRDIKWRLTPEILADKRFREIHDTHVMPTAHEVHLAADACFKLHERLKEAVDVEEDRDQSPYMTDLLQLNAYAGRLSRLSAVLRESTDNEPSPDTVRWMEIDSQNPRVVKVARCPLHVGEALSTWLYDKLKTIVMTSATLSVQRDFKYLKRRLGIDMTERTTVETLSLDSPFNYEKQALLCIPTDICMPDAKGFLDEVVDHVREILRITHGHAFVLFTSFYALDYVHRRLEAELKRDGMTPFKQGQMNRTTLLDRFRECPSGVLFGTDSFWEGVDVAGDALQCVILPKLPFRVPTEPLQEARAEAIDAAGGNSFMEFTVPQAVIKFRQGLGRLIRRKTDRGAVIVLDRRIVTKHYGRVFLESLPAMRLVQGPRRGVYESLRTFFNEESGETHG